MPRSCGVKGCKTSPEQCRLFSIPRGAQNAARRQEWLLALNKSSSDCHKYIQVCEKHFCIKDIDFSYRFSSKRDMRLMPNAVPHLNLGGENSHHCRYTSNDATLELYTKDFTEITLKPETLPGESVHSQNNNFQEFDCSEDQVEIISDAGQENIIITVESDDNQNLDEVETDELPVDTGLFEEDYQENVNKTSPLIEKPYFKSVKCYMTGCNKFSEVCRVCFRSLSRQEEVVKLCGKETSTEDQTRIKNMLKLVLPDLDLEIFGDTIICKKCTELLEYSYQLKQTWLSAEAILQRILEKNRTAINQNAYLVISKEEIKDTILSEVGHDYSKISINQQQTEDEFKFFTSNDSAENAEVSLGEVNASKVIATEPAHCQTRIEKKTRGVRPCMCERCGRIYSHPVKLKRHIADFHIKREDGKKPKEPEFMCEICGKLFLFYKSLLVHNEIHTKLQCTICSKEFHRIKSLKAHVYRVHKNGTFQCHLCGKQLANAGSFKFHLQGHGPKRKAHACSICDKKFTAYRYLRKHIRTHVTNSWSCTICGKCLKYEKSLQKHIKLVHMGQGEFLCEYCDRPFWEKKSLQKHRIRTHGWSHEVEKVQQDTQLEEEIRFCPSLEIGTTECVV